MGTAPQNIRETYIRRNEQQLGPYSGSVLKEMFRESQFEKGDMLWDESDQTWKTPEDFFVPPPALESPAEPPVAAPVRYVSRIKKSLSILPAVVTGLIGGGLVFVGCVEDVVAKTVMQEEVATIQYCTGFVLVGVTFLLASLRDIGNNQ